jgi:hypothetical protein
MNFMARGLERAPGMFERLNVEESSNGVVKCLQNQCLNQKKE